jgi:hypothetical protein
MTESVEDRRIIRIGEILTERSIPSITYKSKYYSTYFESPWLAPKCGGQDV